MKFLYSLPTIIRKFLRGVQGWFLDTWERVPAIPSRIQALVIGKSLEQRPITCYRFGNGPRKVLFCAGIHGNEVGMIKFAQHVIRFLDLSSEKFSRCTFYVLPCLNPDGYHLARKHPGYFSDGRVGRFNANGVDLNRNFDAPSFTRESVWAHGKNYTENTQVFCGNFPFSEPESRALQEFIFQEDIRILYMLHNRGADVVSSPDTVAQELAKIYVARTGFRLISEKEWQALELHGTVKEWAQLHDISYVEVEGITRWGSDWKRQRAALTASLEWLDQGQTS